MEVCLHPTSSARPNDVRVKVAALLEGIARNAGGKFYIITYNSCLLNCILSRVLT